MKAVISDKIYLKVDAELRGIIENKLTYKVPVYVPGKFNQTKSIRMYQRISKDILAIPAGRLDLIPKEHELLDKRYSKVIDFPSYDGTVALREDQQIIYDQVEGSSLINAQPGWGKTFTGLAIAKKLSQKTLVVTHTVFLRDQWVAQVKNMFGFTPSIIGSGSFNTETPIVVSNVQTLTTKHNEINKLFGTLLIDECHRAPAATFLEIVNNSYAKNKIGLSATLVRKDGYHVILKDLFGDKVYVPPIRNQMVPTIVAIETDIVLPTGGAWANRVTQVLESLDYVNLVIKLVAAQLSRGHKILVVSDRVDILKLLHEIFEENSEYVGGETPDAIRNNLETRMRKGEIDIIFGSSKIFSEGISIDCLSCLIPAMIIDNDPLLTQLIGRVTREEAGKKQPEVLDLRLKGATARNQATNRLGLYMQLGFPIKTTKAL